MDSNSIFVQFCYPGLNFRCRHSGKNCHAVEIIINLKVTKSGKLLKILGYPTPVEINGRLELSFCYGECDSLERGFQISAISLVRFGPGTEPSPYSNVYNPRPCECRNQGLGYNLIKEKCSTFGGLQSCNFKTGCKRPNAFYANAGALCKNEAQIGDCSGTVTTAVSFDARYKNLYKDPSGVEYIPEHYIMHLMLGNQERRGKILNVECPEIFGLPKNCDEECAEQIYKTVVLTNPARRGEVGAWIAYPLPICQDGRYEVTLKTLEPFHNFPNRRSFDISLNNVTVIFGLDLVRLSQGKKCALIDIIIEFEVSKGGTELLAHGHTYPVKLHNGQVEIKFSNGGCNVPDHSPILSAMTLLRFGEGTKKCPNDWYSHVTPE